MLKDDSNRYSGEGKEKPNSHRQLTNANLGDVAFPRNEHTKYLSNPTSFALYT